ncbi:MAG TPA: MFS transporter, partial [Thermomicrobiales bacterium]|nr:MFS transporter [Thermomicrobiales bacterium]
MTAVFFINGAVFSNWVARIPQVQQSLGMSEGQFGLALLSLGIGALLSLLAAGWLVAKLGSKPVTTLSALASCLVLPFLAIAPSAPTLALALFAFGMANGALDVAMNSQGVLVQQRFGRPILSSMHAAFSFGGFAGAATGGVIAALDVAPEPHLIAIGIIAAAGMFAASRLLLAAHE